MEHSAYTRLPGHAIALFRGRRLWLGPDHVLVVQSAYLSEQYRRYYFRDIQAIVVTETSNLLSNLFYGMAVLMAGVCAYIAYSSGSMIAGFFAVLAVILFLIGIRIPNCAAYLRTATTLERLPSLGRLEAARRTLFILETMIERAQGGPLSREPVESNIESPIPAP